MCGQHNVRASAEDNTGQNTDKGHTPNPRTEIKIPDPAGNQTRAAGMEGRDSTEHATATDIIWNIITPKNQFLTAPLVATNSLEIIDFKSSLEICLNVY